MKILYFAMLRDVTCKSEETWTRPAATLGELVHDLVATYGKGFERWLVADGKMSDLAIIMVNGQDVRHLQGFDTPLQASDTVVIFPPVAGGSYP